MPSPSRPSPSPSSPLHPPGPALHQPSGTDLQPPPSPRTHRALRRLQSAHTLGATRVATNPPSLISQQRRDLYRNVSPTRDIANHSPHRSRAYSDASSPLGHPGANPAGKRANVKKPIFSHGHLSLQQIIREGPNDDDYPGALESARWKVVDEGIKSAEDGMVRDSCWPAGRTDELIPAPFC